MSRSIEDLQEVLRNPSGSLLHLREKNRKGSLGRLLAMIEACQQALCLVIISSMYNRCSVGLLSMEDLYETYYLKKTPRLCSVKRNPSEIFCLKNAVEGTSVFTKSSVLKRPSYGLMPAKKRREDIFL